MPAAGPAERGARPKEGPAEAPTGRKRGPRRRPPASAASAVGTSPGLPQHGRVRRRHRVHSVLHSRDRARLPELAVVEKVSEPEARPSEGSQKPQARTERAGRVGLPREEPRAGPPSARAAGPGRGRRPSEVPSCSFKAASALCGRKGWPGLSAPRNGHVRKSVPQRQRWRLIVQCVVRTLHSSRKSEQGLLLDGAAVCQDPGL